MYVHPGDESFHFFLVGFNFFLIFFSVGVHLSSDGVHFRQQACHHLLPLHIFRLTIQLTTAVFNPIDQSIQSHF
jgi:hypothetical protein